MIRKAILLLMLSSLLLFTCSQNNSNNMILVKGGTFKNSKSNYFGKNVSVKKFHISAKEVSQKEWLEVMLENPSHFKGDNLPVEKVSWYDCLEYCNKKSEKEGLQTYYNIDKKLKDSLNTSEYDLLKWTVSINKKANGYRLPTILEWEYASSGGQLSKNYLYSGSNNINDVAWYWHNSGDKSLNNQKWNMSKVENNNCKTKPRGTKAPNELGLYDMSGNVREWCWEWGEKEDEEIGRAWKGGCWYCIEVACESSFTMYYTPDVKSMDQGFRVARNF